MNTEKIWENLAESIRIEKDGTTIPVPVEDIRALLEERNGDSSSITREFRGKNEGYHIEHDSGKYRYVWIEPGEPNDYGDWRSTEQSAIDSAWEDWETNGQGYYWANWSKKLAVAAGHVEG